MTWLPARLSRVRDRDDAGSALVLSLVFLMLFAVLVGVVLEFAATGQRSAVTVRAEATNTYAGGGAIEGAIDSLRDNLTTGLATGGTTTCFTLPASALGNDTPITVTCEPRPGSGAALGGSTASQPENAVLALSSSSTEGISLASTANVTAQGSVAVAQRLLTPAGSTLRSTGTVTAGTCSGSGTVSPACTSPSTTSDPGWAGPSAGPLPHVTTLPACSSLITLTPGIYRSASGLQGLLACTNAVIWLQPGTYYFDFVDNGSHELATAIGDAIVGGKPPGWTPATTAASADPVATIPKPTAASPTTSSCDPTAAGVDLVFGGDSRLSVGGGNVQICALETGTTAQHIALRGLTNALNVTATTTAVPATATPAGTSKWPWTNPQNGAVIDGAEAYVKVPTRLKAGDEPPKLTVGPMLTLPADALGPVSVAVSMRSRAAGTGLLTATIDPGDGSAPLSRTTRTCAPCPAGSPAQTEVVTLTGLTTAQANGMTVTFAVLNQDVRPMEAWVDGVSVEASYALAVRPSCQLTSSTGGCDGSAIPTEPLLRATGSAAGSTLAIHGTVYAPRAAVDLGLTSVPYTVVDRGVAVRHVDLSMTPAAGYVGPLVSIPIIGLAPRRIRLVAADGAGTVLATADATFANAAGTQNGRQVEVNEWAVR